MKKEHNDFPQVVKKEKKKFDFGEVEIIESIIFKITLNNEIEISESHINEFMTIINQKKISQYGILLDVYNPFFYSEQVASELSEDPKLKALAIIVENKDILYRSKFMLDLSSLLPNPFKVPVKPFKNEDVAIDWLKRKLNKTIL